MALGVLTKGPVAILIPLAVSAIFFIWMREWRAYLKALFHIPSIMLFLLIITPWYYLEYMAQGQAFIDGFFFKHNLNRFSNSMESHSGPIVYYIVIVILGMLPFTSIVFKALSNFRAKLQEPLTLFLLIWFLFVLLFFSFSGTKLPHYVIYGYTALIILMAREVPRIQSENLLFLPFVLFLLLMITFPDIMTLYQDKIKNEYINILVQNIHQEFGLGYKLLLFIALLSVLFLRLSQLKLEYKMIATGLLFIIVLNFGVLKSYANLAQQPIKEAALISKSQNLKVTMWGINMPTFIFYAQRTVAKREPNVGEIVISKVPKLKKIAKYDVIYEKYGIVLAKVVEKIER